MNEVCILIDEKIEEYFRKTDVEQRKTIMQEMRKEYSDEIRAYSRIHDLRYASRKKDKVLDYFIRGWVLLTGLGGALKLRPDKRTMKQLDEIKDCLCLDEYNASSPEDKEIFDREYLNMTEFYINMALKDKSYGSAFMGLMRISDDKMREKIATEIYAVSYRVPKKLDCIDVMEPIRLAMTKGYAKIFPDYTQVLERIIDENNAKDN